MDDTLHHKAVVIVRTVAGCQLLGCFSYDSSASTMTIQLQKCKKQPTECVTESFQIESDIFTGTTIESKTNKARLTSMKVERLAGSNRFDVFYYLHNGC